MCSIYNQLRLFKQKNSMTKKAYDEDDHIQQLT